MTTPATGRRLRWLLPALLVVAFLAIAGPIGSLAGKTAEVQENDNAAYLPTSAESTQVDAYTEKFVGDPTLPAVVVYVRTDGGALTDVDLAAIATDVEAVNATQRAKLAGPPVGPVPSEDGKAAQLIVQYAGADPEKLRGDVEWLRDRVKSHPGLAAHVTGPAGVFADLLVVFDSINGVLLLVTAAVVLVILVIVYRSPLLPLLVLLGAGAALAQPGELDAALANSASHGLSEVLYAYASTGNNNGSAFAGLTVTSPFFQTTLGLAMLFGRFVPILAVLALAGSLAAQKRVEPGAGTLPTTGALFGVLVGGTVVLVAALTFFPALALGPLVEALS